MNWLQETDSQWDKYRMYWDRHAGRAGAVRAVTHMSERQYAEYYNAILDTLIEAPPIKVIDLGCGPGLMYPVLVQRYPGIDYLGLDISAEMIRVAENRNPDARFKLLEQPLIPETCDLLLCHSVFTHTTVKDTRAYLEQISWSIGFHGLAIVSIHTDCDQGVKGGIGRVDYAPAHFENILATHGLETFAHVDALQRYYGVRRA